MLQLLLGSVLLSILHALLPNHWLPLLSIARTDRWTVAEVTWVAFLCGVAHAFSTILIGFGLGFLGLKLSSDFSVFTLYFAPLFLIALGIFFIYQHHRHHHFNIQKTPGERLSRAKIITALAVAMFFSPCLEVEGFFLLAGTHGTWAIATIALIYVVLSISGMTLWTQWAFRKAMKVNWHSLEHNAGIITGVTLILTGVISFFIS